MDLKPQACLDAFAALGLPQVADYLTPYGHQGPFGKVENGDIDLHQFRNEIRETFKISKVGTIAGCMVTDGKIFRNSKIRIIREGVVVYTGELTALKRFKDDVKDVSKGYDCGIQIKNYNDIEQLDIIEAFQEVEVKKKLK